MDNYNSTYGKKYNNKLMSTKEGHIYKRFHARKSHAKKNKIPFSITINYMVSIASDVCPILNIPLSWCVQGKLSDNSPTIDRIDPALGYVVGNVAWISNRANRIKNDGNASEHLAIYNYITAYV
jgi:hypothetical protein